ncbi:hypothetical protein OZX58_02165 [Lactobacillus sp. ESL0680]|uniref:hypothetical protein n=1 Tax=Lactobacillus sp. ESL0680 TaxID=2983210 RepID=UPI0023F7BE7C|nr:hypothetical protein [Lactobacillus sp. ESL0680]WEV39065.1 hypothetical protein OZX58_02165 [Lactobacillus sp. ESL0680]
MKSNFDFLNKDQDTQILHRTAVDVEELYADGKFSNEFESIRKIIENVARQILDLNFVATGDRSTFNDCLRKIKYRNFADKDILDKFYELKNNGFNHAKMKITDLPY